MIVDVVPLFVDVRVVRDDLYPFLGGGNKGRKMDYIARDINIKRANALVTTGGIQSNHCRAAAIYAARHQLACSLILHGSKQEFLTQGGNAKIMRDSGARCVFVDNPSDIASAMDAEMICYQKAGLRPYYLYGGGHTSEGGLAYIDAVEQLKMYCEGAGWSPDYIFLASGTGSTQAGILAGLAKHCISSKVVGISVGRRKAQAESVVREFYNQLCARFNIDQPEAEILVLDDYLCGGYGQYNECVKNISDTSLVKYGFVLDVTYTAKAFYGMVEFVKANKLESKKILFWHTGGILNYLA